MNSNTTKASTALIVPAASAVENPRTLDVIGAEIRTFAASMLNNIIEIGRRLCEAKEMLPYGQFGDWIKANTGFSRSKANDFMRLFQEYGARQGSLFGATLENEQAFGKLTYTKALALLDVPAEEREQFVADHDVDSMSTRELQAVIAERDKALKELEDARDHIDRMSETFATATSEAEANKKLVEALGERVQELEACPVEVLPDQEAIDKAVAEAVEKANAAHAAELQKLKDSEEKKRKALEKKAADAEKNAQAAEEKAAQAGKGAASEADTLRAEANKQRAEAERLRRELAMSGEVTVTFKVYFAAWQKAYANMRETLEKADEETAGRLKAAIEAQIKGWTNG